jgi:hypothetical protein
MESFHHKPIKRFFLDGDIYDDATIYRLKTEYIKLLILEMKLSGYVPRLDIDPDFTIEYNIKAEIFRFQLSMHGVYVGKKKSEWIQGIDGVLVVPIPQNRSNEFSQEQASQ